MCSVVTHRATVAYAVERAMVRYREGGASRGSTWLMSAPDVLEWGRGERPSDGRAWQDSNLRPLASECTGPIAMVRKTPISMGWRMMLRALLG